MLIYFYSYQIFNHLKSYTIKKKFVQRSSFLIREIILFVEIHRNWSIGMFRFLPSDSHMIVGIDNSLDIIWRTSGLYKQAFLAIILLAMKR